MHQRQVVTAEDRSDELATAVDAELVKDCLQVILNSVFRDMQRMSDLGRGTAAGDQQRNLAFAFGQLMNRCKKWPNLD